MFGPASARRSSLRATLVAACWLAGGRAGAATPVTLTWSAPPQCPQLEAVRGWLMAHLGDRADPAGYPGVRSRGDMQRSAAGWTLRLAIERDGSPGVRSLDGGDCAELARTGALALAIALEPALGEAPQPEAPQPVAPSVPESPEPPRSPPPIILPPPPPAPIVRDPGSPGEPTVPEPLTPVSPADEPRRPPGHLLRVAGGVEAGLLPGVGGGLSAGYGLRLPWLRLELLATYWPARRQDSAAPGVSARASLAAAQLRLCPTPRLRAARSGEAGAPGLVELPLCAGLELGALAVRGDGYSDARKLVQPWLAVEVQPAIVWRFTRGVALWGGLALVVPITRGAYRIDPLPELFRVGAVGLRALLGVEWQPGSDPRQKFRRIAGPRGTKP